MKLFLLWALLAGVSLPLAIVSIAAIATKYLVTEPPSEDSDPVLIVSSTLWVGPIPFTINLRPWAGILVLLGISLTMVGTIALLHFPTISSMEPIGESLTDNSIDEVR